MIPWLAALLAPPMAIAVLGMSSMSSSRLRLCAAVAAALSLAAAATVFVVPGLAALQVDWPWPVPSFFGPALLRVGQVSAPLLLLPATIWFVAVVVTPQRQLDRTDLQYGGLATTCVTFAFLTESPVLLALLWMVSSWLFLRALAPEDRRLRRVVGGYQWLSAVLLVAGVGLMGDADTAQTGLWLVAASVLIRQGIFPFHAWIPEAFDNGRPGPAALFCAPQLGAYVALILLVPQADAGLLRVVAILSLVTAVYGASLAVIQRDARRACGYLFVSQSALVLAGLDCTSVGALAGSLVLWMSSALAITGMARAILALEARRGRLDLATMHGGYEQMRFLAASFLVFGLACTGFPGTLGFVGQEMLIDGAVRDFPVLGFLTIIATALTGIAVLRMYFSLFCGGHVQAPSLRLRRREAIIFCAVAGALIVAGLLPQPIVASRLRASEALVQQRASAVERMR